MGKVIHKLFKAVVKELNNELPNLGESGSEVSQFITEPSNLSEVAILPEDGQKVLVKSKFEIDQKFNQILYLSHG